jgi:hypothetical protein
VENMEVVSGTADSRGVSREPAWKLAPSLGIEGLTPRSRTLPGDRSDPIRVNAMPYSKHVADPEHVEAMRSAFQKVCETLGL